MSATTWLGVLAAALIALALYSIFRAAMWIRNASICLNHIDASLHHLNALIAERSNNDNVVREIQDLQVAERTLQFLASGTVQNHLATLGKPDATEPRFSYALSAASRSLDPDVEYRSRDTVVCSIVLGESYAQTVAPCIASHSEFSEQHGYSYAVLRRSITGFQRPAPWYKFPLLARLLDDGFKRILYIDADALVTNPSIDPEPLFRKLETSGKALMLTEDEAGINAGVFFARSSPDVIRLLDLTWLFDADRHHPLLEQHALQLLMTHHPQVRGAILVEPDPRKFNSFPLERRKLHPTRDLQLWESGDFICHVSGIRSPQLEEVIGAYGNRRTRGVE
jgi:hypothetical protein